jgi:hypothetical protein
MLSGHTVAFFLVSLLPIQREARGRAIAVSEPRIIPPVDHRTDAGLDEEPRVTKVNILPTQWPI